MSSNRGRRTVTSRDGSQMELDLFTTNDQRLNPYPRKIINCYEKVAKIAEGQKALGHKIVVTIGSWDGVHEGQLRYILKASQLGDFLIVGVDSDRAIKSYKLDDWRPVRNQDRRAELVTYPEFVDVVTLVDDVDENGKWQYGLLKAVKPDVYVAVTNSYPEEQLKEIQEFCPELIVLDPQGVGISTTQEIMEVVEKRMRKGVDLMFQSLRDGKI